MNVYISLYINLKIYQCIYVYTWKPVLIATDLSNLASVMRIYIYICIYIYLYIYIYIYI